jgi:paraquat-inducible protein A
LSIIYALYANEEFFLCGVIAMFSVVFPFLKLLYLLTLVTSPDMPHEFRVRSIAAMEWLGRYSMTDVMVLALIIFYVNSSGYSEAQVQPGIYFFAASALMTMFAYGWAHTVAPRAKVRTVPAELVEVPATRGQLVKKALGNRQQG